VYDDEAALLAAAGAPSRYDAPREKVARVPGAA